MGHDISLKVVAATDTPADVLRKLNTDWETTYPVLAFDADDMNVGSTAVIAWIEEFDRGYDRLIAESRFRTGTHPLFFVLVSPATLPSVVASIRQAGALVETRRDPDDRVDEYAKKALTTMWQAVKTGPKAGRRRRKKVRVNPNAPLVKPYLPDAESLEPINRYLDPAKKES